MGDWHEPATNEFIYSHKRYLAYIKLSFWDLPTWFSNVRYDIMVHIEHLSTKYSKNIIQNQIILRSTHFVSIKQMKLIAMILFSLLYNCFSFNLFSTSKIKRRCFIRKRNTHEKIKIPWKRRKNDKSSSDVRIAKITYTFFVSGLHEW